MIPAGVDLDDLVLQLDEDSVAFDALVPPERAAELEPGIINAVAHAADTDFGSLGVVVLQHAPAQTADMRDVAQDLLMISNLDTVIVRAPYSGAVVSDVYSRAELEVAQYPFLGNPDVVGATFRFIDDVNRAAVSWPWVIVMIVLAVAVIATFTAIGVRPGATRRAKPSSFQG